MNFFSPLVNKRVCKYKYMKTQLLIKLVFRKQWLNVFYFIETRSFFVFIHCYKYNGNIEIKHFITKSKLSDFKSCMDAVLIVKILSLIKSCSFFPAQSKRNAALNFCSPNFVTWKCKV